MAISSLTLFAGIDGWIANSIGARAVMPTGMIERAGSKGSLARTAAVAGYDEV